MAFVELLQLIRSVDSKSATAGHRKESDRILARKARECAMAHFDSADEELVRRAVEGDERAVAQLLDPWIPRILAWCHRMGRPGLDPDDVAQDVVEVVIQKLYTLREPRAFPAWLYRITKSVRTADSRRAWFVRWVGGIDDGVLGRSNTLISEFEIRERSRRVQAVLDQPSDRHREVLVLVKVEGFSAPEVAELLKLPEGTVRSRLRHGLQRFKRFARKVGLEPDEERVARVEEVTQ